MGKSRVAALVLAVAIVALGVMRTATASHNATHKAFSGGATFKGLVVKTDSSSGVSVTAVSPSWQTIDSRGFQIPAGDSQLIVADLVARTHCSGSGGSCFVRVLVGRTLGTALQAEPGPVGIDGVSDDGTESHAMSGALCVRNATASPADVSVWVQATKNSANVTAYNLGSYTFKIARNSTCSPSVDI